MSDEKGDKSVLIPEISMWNRSIEKKMSSDEDVTEKKEIEEVPRAEVNFLTFRFAASRRVASEQRLSKVSIEQSSLLDGSIKIEETIGRNSEADGSVRRELTPCRDATNFDVTLSVEQLSPRLDNKFSGATLSAVEITSIADSQR